MNLSRAELGEKQNKGGLGRIWGEMVHTITRSYIIIYQQDAVFFRGRFLNESAMQQTTSSFS